MRCLIIALLACTLFAAPVRSVENVVGKEDQAPALPKAPRVTISVESRTVRLTWTPLPGKWEYEVQRSETLDFSEAFVVGTTQDTVLEDREGIRERGMYLYRVVARSISNLDDPDYRVIESFEEPIVLESYSEEEDQEPAGWGRVVDGAESPAAMSLELSGNTWKRQAIDPRGIEDGDVWQLVIRGLTRGEVQAFGIADSANEMWYQIWGLDAVHSEGWVAAYTGWFEFGEWHTLDLPVAEDWLGRFGYHPRVQQLLYANDNDEVDEPGVFRIDEIRDVSQVMPEPLDLEIVWDFEGAPVQDSLDVMLSVTGLDPERPIHSFFWTLGDGCVSRAAELVHRYRFDRSYSVVLRYEEADGCTGWARSEIVLGAGRASRSVSMISFGDLMIARRYEDQGGVIDCVGVEGIFDPLRELIGSVDLAMCNLECPFTLSDEEHPTKEYTFKGRPEYLPPVADAGIDYCALGNNHNLDYMVPGMVETQFLLDSLGLLSSGSGANDRIARRPAIFSQNGLSVAILSFCNRDGVDENLQPFLHATRSRPGFAHWKRSQIEQTIPQARELADLVIVQSHSGTEYAGEPSALDDPSGLGWDPEYHTFELLPDTTDRNLRTYAIDLGADVVINHHPHVIQGIETYDGKLIAHSMGNFAFDQRFPETFVSMGLQAWLTPGGAVDFVIHPIYIEGYIPRVATGRLARGILDYVSDLSRPLNTTIVRNPEREIAHVIHDVPTGIRGRTFRADAVLEERGDYWVSAPLAFNVQDYVAGVRVSDSLDGVEFRVGRELFWMGNFEEEGADPWLLNSEYEGYDDQGRGGTRCLRLTRPAGSVLEIGTLMTYRWPFDVTHEYSVAVWLTTENANSAALNFRYYDRRSTSYAIEQQTIGAPIEGDTAWVRQWSDLAPPGETLFCNFWMSTWGWLAESAEVRFDDIEWIRWEGWQTDAIDVPFPSNVSHIQIRSAVERDSVGYEFRTRWIPVGNTWPVHG